METEADGAPNGTGGDSGGAVRPDGWRLLLGLYAFYLAAAIALTWPVAAYLGRRLPGWPGDPQMFVWNIWWLKHSLFALHQSPFWVTEIAWPFGVSFAFHTHTILHSAIAILLEFIGINWAASVSLLFLNSFALTGLGTYLWCREFGAGRRASLVGGFVVAFCIYRLGRGIGHYNLTTTEFLPFFWLAAKRAYEGGRWRAFLVAAVCLLLMFWQDIQLVVFGLLFAVFLFAAVVWRQPRGLLRGRFWLGSLAAAAVLAIGTLPYWRAVIPLMIRGEYTAREGIEPIAADLVSFFIPTPYHPIFGKWAEGVHNQFRYSHIDTAYLGYVTILLVILGRWGARAKRLRVGWMVLAGLFFLLLTFGEHVDIMGQSKFRIFGRLYTIALPGKFIDRVPGLREFRVYSRFVILAVFAFAVPAALGVDWLLGKLRASRIRHAVVPLILLLFSFEVAMVPYKTHDFLRPNYAPYGLLQRIADDPERATVFTVPPAFMDMHEQYMQMFHGKPIFGASLARRPSAFFKRYYSLPGIGWLFWRRQDLLDEERLKSFFTPEFLSRFIDFYNIKYLILAPSPKYAFLRELIGERFPIEQLWTEDAYVLYRLKRPKREGPFEVDLSNIASTVYFGRGFWFPSAIGTWAMDREAELYLPIRGTDWKALVVEMTPFKSSDGTSQTAELFLNGHSLGSVTLEPEAAFYQFSIAEGVLVDRPYNTLSFRFGYCVSPYAKGFAKDRSKLAAAVRKIQVLAEPRGDVDIVENGVR